MRRTSVRQASNLLRSRKHCSIQTGSERAHTTFEMNGAGHSLAGLRTTGSRSLSSRGAETGQESSQHATLLMQRSVAIEERESSYA
jgi:hypothetical protein